MRLIKFRGWDKSGKRMLSNPLVTDIDSAASYIGINDIPSKLERYSVTLQQYIGIVDVDGKEVYEGDILEHSGCSKSYVEYRDGCFCLVHGHFYNNEKVGEYVQAIGHLDFLKCKPKVIGNVYEHPELL